MRRYGLDALGISEGHRTGPSELVKPDGSVTSYTGRNKDTKRDQSLKSMSW